MSSCPIPDNDMLEDEQSSAQYKFKRTGEKSNEKLKSNLSLRQGRILEIKSNYNYVVGLSPKPVTGADDISETTVIDQADSRISCTLGGRTKQYLMGTRALAAVGDFVEVDSSSAPHYRIENILPRKNALSRFGTGKFQQEIIIAANLDQVIITASWRQPMLKPGLIDRYICIANIYDIEPVICITKADLCDQDLEGDALSLELDSRSGSGMTEVVDSRSESGMTEVVDSRSESGMTEENSDPQELLEDISERHELETLINYYTQCGYKTILCSVVTGEGMEDLREQLRDRESVFSGQSGTGKSSLINYLEPELDLATAEVSSFNDKGKHTTTQAILIPWSFGGYLVDTPGIKTVNLHAAHKELIPRVFPGFSDLYPKCYFRTCTHTHEENCAIKQAVENDQIPIERYDSYIRIMESL